MDYSQLPKNSGVYKIVCKINNKIYIGSSVNLRHRANRHQNDLKNNKHLSKHLQNAYNRYGENNFDFIIIEEYQRNKIKRDELIKREQVYLDKLKPFLNKNGYNTCPKAHSPNVGKLSPETRKKISIALTNRPVSEETREKLRISGRKRQPTPEMTEKNRQWHKGIKQSEGSIEKRARPYAFIGPDGKIYKGKNLKRFAEKHNLHRPNLKMVLNEKRKSHHGFTKYEE